MFPEEMIRPMRQELTSIGFRELRSPGEVDGILKNEKGTVLVVVNSVCGCAAGRARPAVARALAHSVRPEILATVFAGQDREATERARTYFTDYAPSCATASWSTCSNATRSKAATLFPSRKISPAPSIASALPPAPRPPNRTVVPRDRGESRNLCSISELSRVARRKPCNFRRAAPLAPAPRAHIARRLAAAANRKSRSRGH